ncbi:MAG: hypothetical protein ACN4GM_06065 [Gammaproteobacteria bacterium]
MNKSVKNGIIIVVALLVMLAAQLNWVDEIGENYTEQGFKRALITYGIARSLNAVISVAQGTEVAIEPVGVGVTFTPGQILDPINDMVERFSWVVMASGASLGVQRILLQMTAWQWFSGLVSLSLILALFIYFKQNSLSPSIRTGFYKWALVLVIIRFTVPMIAIVNEGIYRVFLQPQYETSKQMLEQATESLDRVNQTDSEAPSPVADQSFMERLQSLYQSAANSMEVESKLDALKNKASEISEYALNMIVVFVIQTLLFPLLFLWLAVKLIKRVISI